MKLRSEIPKAELIQDKISEKRIRKSKFYDNCVTKRLKKEEPVKEL